MDSSDITAIRLYNQRISYHDFKTPQQLVGWMGAMQAQDYAGAKWSIGLRVPGLTETDVERAVTDRKILRSWPQRGTIHFILPEETRWRLALTETRMLARARSYHQKAGLDEHVFAKAKKVFTAALASDKQLTRPELMETLNNSGISTKDQRGYHILWYLSQTAFMCFGPLRGKQVTFALLDDWAPQAEKLSYEQSLAKLVLGYYTSHGPATVQDLMWWSGLRATEINAGLDMAGKKLVSQEIDGKTYFMALGITPPPLPQTNVHLLQTFDEYLLGYKDRTAALDQQRMKDVVPGNNGMYMSTVVVNGKIEALWRRTIKKDKVLIEIQPFKKFTTAENQAMTIEVHRYGKFLGLPAELQTKL